MRPGSGRFGVWTDAGRSGGLAAAWLGGSLPEPDGGSPAARCEAVSLPELACQVALVGEPGLAGGLRERRPAFDGDPRQVEAAADAVPVGGGPERPPEVAGKGEPVGSGDLFQDGGRRLLPGVRGQVLPG